MPCVNCQASTNVPPGGLTPDDICNGKYVNTDCVIYRGEPLTEIQAETNDSVTTILTTLDTIVGTIIAGSFTANNGLSKDTSTNVQLGGTLIKNTTVIGTIHDMKFTGNRSSPFTYVLQVENASNGSGISSSVVGVSIGVFSSAPDGTALYGLTNSSNGQGVFGYSTGLGTAITAQSVLGVGIAVESYIRNRISLSGGAVGTIDAIMDLDKAGGNGVAGGGLSIDFYLRNSGSASPRTGRIASVFSDPTNLNEDASLDFYTINNGALSRVTSFLSTGQLKLDNYTTSTSFASVSGASVGVLNVDNAGNVFVGAGGGGGGITTADNGLRASTSTNVQLGGLTAPGEPLLQNTYIDASTFGLFLTGSVTASTGILNVSQTNAGAYNAIVATSVAGLAISGTSISNSAIYGSSTSGYGGDFTSASSSGLRVTNTATTTTTALILGSPSSTNNLKTILTIDRSSSGTAANGIGGSIDYSLKTSLNISELSNRISSKWTDVTSATRTSVLEFYGVFSGTTFKTFAIDGSGTLWTQLAAFDDNAAAVAFGLTAGQVYMTTGSGASPLNVAGIMMVVQ